MPITIVIIAIIIIIIIIVIITIIILIDDNDLELCSVFSSLTLPLVILKTIVHFIFLSFCLSLPSFLCVDTHKQQQRVAVFNRSLSLRACLLCITRSSFYYQLSRRKKLYQQEYFY